jgi:hypothetical protein
MGSGQDDVKRYNRHLSNLIHSGKAKPSFLVSHELALDDAAEAYQHFDVRDTGCTKVVLKPGATHEKRHKLAHAGERSAPHEIASIFSISTNGRGFP